MLSPFLWWYSALPSTKCRCLSLGASASKAAFVAARLAVSLMPPTMPVGKPELLPTQAAPAVVPCTITMGVALWPFFRRYAMSSGAFLATSAACMFQEQSMMIIETSSGAKNDATPRSMIPT